MNQNPSVQYSLMPATHGGDVPLECSDDKCNRKIINGGAYFMDVLENGAILCDDCGKCLRYTRKKAHERGE